MALTNCKECNRQVSDLAKSCPHCGAKDPAEKPTYLGRILFGVVVIFGLIAAVSNSPEKSKSLTSDYQPTKQVAITHRKINEIDAKTSCDYLKNLGFRSQGWGQLVEGDYGCPSEEKLLGKVSATNLQNDIRYYVVSKDGTHLSELKIFLNISDLEQSTAATQTMVKATNTLLGKLGLKNVSAEIKNAILAGQSTQLEKQGFRITVSKTLWENNRNYTLIMLIN